MSNLATMIMEGSMNGYSRANLTHTYGHEDGAGLIAMESAEALRDIFEAEFYVPNSCTLQATLEGASSVEESSQAAIMEASIRGAFAKIKEFFIKLKDKVKEFLHNVKRYLLGIFGNDEKWVRSYEKELTALKSEDLKGYEVKMYNYTLEPISALERQASSDEIYNTVRNEIEDMFRAERVGETERTSEELDDNFDEIYSAFLSAMLDADGDEEVDKRIWSSYRDNAESENDKENVTVYPNIKRYIETIKKSSSDLGKIDSCATKIDNKFKKAIKLVDDTEKRITKEGATFKDERTGNLKMNDGTLTGQKKTAVNWNVTETGVSNFAAVLRKYSSFLSKQQTVMNKVITGYKTATVERNKAYKKALTGAFGYARKNKKK